MIANDIQNLLIDNNLKDNDFDIEYYIYNVPQSVNNAHKITVLVTEMMRRPSLFGSNIYQRNMEQVQVQIFYPEGYEEDCDLIAGKITNIMEDDKWSIRQSRLSSDPSTDRLFYTLQYIKHNERRGI